MDGNLRLEELSRALKRYEEAIAEFRQRVETSDQTDDLDYLHTSIVTPAMEEFERLCSIDEEEHRGLVERLRQCHEASRTATFELRNPPKSISAEEHKVLAAKVKAIEANWHRIGLALIKYRK
jgi:hypothetical protein